MYRIIEGIIRTAEYDGEVRTYHKGRLLKGLVESYDEDKKPTGLLYAYTTKDVQFVARDDETQSPEFIGGALHDMYAEDLFKPHEGMCIAFEEPAENAKSIGYWTLASAMQNYNTFDHVPSIEDE